MRPDALSDSSPFSTSRLSRAPGPGRVLFLVVLCQFCCTSLWFAGNGVMSELANHFGLQDQAQGHMTAAVQLGFITGTLLFAVLMLADRLSPSLLFFISAAAGAASNLLLARDANSLPSLLLFRFLTGFFLAGVYPVGMKIAADHFPGGLGRSLGFLVGALVLGTAFPHLLHAIPGHLEWKTIIRVTSGLALAGGTIVLLAVPDGPSRQAAIHTDLATFLKIFRDPGLRSAAGGYFGHMWELYAFWAFVPFLVNAHGAHHPGQALDGSIWSFMAIAAGGPACVFAGYWAQRFGTRRTAFQALMGSGICCLLSPWMITLAGPELFAAYLFCWGMLVVADSPLFSTLVAQQASPGQKGTALTIVTCVGFAITIVSIQLLNGLSGILQPEFLFLFLAPGPILGLWSLARPV